MGGFPGGSFRADESPRGYLTYFKGLRRSRRHDLPKGCAGYLVKIPEGEHKMPRKRLTQLFPFLIPIRIRQRLLFYYASMRFDKNIYSRTKAPPLANTEFSASLPLRNTETGFDMIYQENKIFNLKLASDAVNGLLIKPGETFSFSLAVKGADKKTRYKDGLVMMNGRLTPAYGGGMCQLTDLIFLLFLHSPLIVTERHGHKIKDFPDLCGCGMPKGIDATVFEGWLDLKVKNTTRRTFQLNFDFSENEITGFLLSDCKSGCNYAVANGKVIYRRIGGKIYEEAEVIRIRSLSSTGEKNSEKLLYTNICEIGYTLPKEVEIIESA